MLVELKLKNVGIDPFYNMPFINFTTIVDRNKSAIIVYIGTFEAQCIALALGREKPERPSPYDTMTEILKYSSLKIKRVYISDLRVGGTFFGSIELFNESTNQTVRIDSRVSDAIALAVRCKCKIFTTDIVLNKYKSSKPSSFSDKVKEVKPSEKETKTEVQKWLDNVKPEDFKNV